MVNSQRQILKRISIYSVTIIIVFSCSIILYKPAKAHKEILFPVLGSAKFSDDFNAARGNTKHNAIDITANKHTPILAAVDGIVTYVAYPQPSYGYMIQITDLEGYKYNYIHINNDTPGTDDGRGGEMNAYAADMRQGNKVSRGQFLGWLGDSGNAESTVSHLHFEIYSPNETAINPYDSLISAAHKLELNRYDYPALLGETLPFEKFTGGVNIAYGNVIGNASKELIVGAGAGGGPHVKVYNSDMSFNDKAFFAYDQNFPGGVDVAAGDINGDGVDEIITGAGAGGGPHVKVFNANGQELGGFFPYDINFRGGVYVAAGDINGDGVDEIITGAGAGGGPHVKVFNANGQELGGFFPYDIAFSGGVDVSSGDVAGGSTDEIVVAAGATGGSHVKIVTYDAQQPQNNRFVSTGSFFAYENFYGGVRVSVGNRLQNTSKAEIVTVPKNQGLPHVKVFDGSGNYISGKMFFEEWWVGFYDVAVGDSISKVAAGLNRRVTVRPGA